MKRKAAEEIAVKILIGKDYSMKKEAGQLLNRYQQLVPSDNEPTRYYEITEKGIHYLQVFAEIGEDLCPEDKA